MRIGYIMARFIIESLLLLSTLVALSSSFAYPKYQTAPPAKKHRSAPLVAKNHEDSMQKDMMILEPGAQDPDVVKAVCRRIEQSAVFGDDFHFLRRLAYVESVDGSHENTYREGYYGGIWQVDESMFAMTQDSTLEDFFEKIQTEFDIDWTSVRWEDLTKPLYSGLAARLYIQYQTQNSPDSPVTVVDQAEFWAAHYRSQVDEKYYISQINELEGGIGLYSAEEAEGLEEMLENEETMNKRQAVYPHRPIGCYQDCGNLGLNAFDRDLPVINIWISGLTRDNCYSFCKQSGYRYAGLQFGNTCTCGHSYGRFGALPPGRCSLGCNGRLLEQCGGFCTNYILGPP